MSSMNVLPGRRNFEIDSTILERIEARERRNNVHGDVTPIMEQATGTYGIIEPVTPGDREGAEVVAARASTAFSSAFQNNPADPVEAAQVAVAEINEEVGRTGQQYRGTFVQFFTDASGDLKALSASIGGGQAYMYPSGESVRSVKSVTDDRDPSQFLNGSIEAVEQVKFDIVDVKTGDRIALASPETEARNTSDSTATTRWLNRVGKRGSTSRSAAALVGRGKGERDKVGIVIDIQEDGEIGTVRFATERSVAPLAMGSAAIREPRGATVAGAEHDNNERRTGRLGKLTAPLAGVAIFGRLLNRDKRGRHAHTNPNSRRGVRERLGASRQRFSSLRTDYQTSNQKYYDDRKDVRGWKRAGVHANAIPQSMLGTYNTRRSFRRDDLRNDPSYEGMTETEKDQAIRRRERKRGVGKLVAFVAVAAAYPLIFDPGQDRKPSFLWMYRKNDDEGADAMGWPLDRLLGLGESDRYDGNGWGYDGSYDNRSPVLNDDPTPGHWDKSNDGLLGDILPASGPFFADGDGFSPPSWWPDAWGGRDETRVWDPGTAGLGPNGKPLPEVEMPPVDVPPAEVPQVDVPEVTPPADPVWDPSPASRVVTPGDGVENLVHKWGHDAVGYENFTGADTHRVTEAMQAKWGEDWLQFADGSDATYIMPDGNIGLRGPGEIKITDENIRRFLFQLIQEQASKP